MPDLRGRHLQAMTRERKLESLGIRLSVSDNWDVDESASEITLRRGPGGAITISTYAHEDPGFHIDAVESCSRFVAGMTKRDVEIKRSSGDAATAEFCDEQGVWWIVRVLASQNRFALATYNAVVHLDPGTSEAREILNSVTFD